MELPEASYLLGPPETMQFEEINILSEPMKLKKTKVTIVLQEMTAE